MASLHQMKMLPCCVSRMKKSLSSPPVPNSGVKGWTTPSRICLRKSRLPVRHSSHGIILPVSCSGRSQKRPRTIHRGGGDSKWGRTGPKTPSAQYASQASISLANQSFAGNSSSSMNATKFPRACSRALLRARAMFFRGSQQYVMSMPTLSRPAATTDAADCLTSLSQTTTEKVKRLPVGCSWISSNRRFSKVGRRNVQMQTVICGSIVFRGQPPSSRLRRAKEGSYREAKACASLETGAIVSANSSLSRASNSAFT